MSKTSDVIVVGAGAIGCAIAERLSREGLFVTLIDRAHPGTEASWAAAGMLAPLAEAAHSTPPQLERLLETSHSLYREFIGEIEERSGLKIGFQGGGSLAVALDYQETKLLAGLLERMLANGKAVEELSFKQLRERHPALSEKVQSALFFPQDTFVNSRELVKALVTAAQNNGACLISNTAVVGLTVEGQNVTGVETVHGPIPGGKTIIAAGSWSGHLDRRLNLTIRPVRGQIVQLQSNTRCVSSLIHSSGCYIVPWPDGRTLVGSTLENVGFNKQTTAAAAQSLLAAAFALVPKLSTAAVTDVWAGLRPDTRDNLPIIGNSSLGNLILATGHFRNGILLTPITARLISELILSGAPSISLEPFRFDRFETE